MTVPPEVELPIGVFDSGVGGLTVVREVMRQLPNERVLYFGDTARVPYGIKSEDTIRRYAAQIAAFLVEQRVKLLIVACNTMAAVATDAIARAAGNVPVLDVIAAGAARTADIAGGRPIGVIGTTATVRSGAYERAIRRLQPDANVQTAACSLFVPLVEEGWLDHEVTRLVAKAYLAPLLATGIGTLVLGCTHYPLLKPLLREVTGNDVELVDSADVTAARAARLLASLGLAASGAGGSGPPAHRFFITDVPQRFTEVGERFLGASLPDVQLVSIDEAAV
jgi:glutamate racemase